MHQSCWIDSINRQIELQVTVAPEINTYIDGVYNVVKTKHFTQNMIELRLAQSTLKTKNKLYLAGTVFLIFLVCNVSTFLQNLL